MQARLLVALLALVCAAAPAAAKNGAPSRLFPYYEEDAGVLLLGEAMYVGTRKEIVESGEHYRFLLSTGIADADITDGRMAVIQLYCCGGKISADQAIWAYVPPDVDVEPQQILEVRMGRVPREGDPGAVNAVTAIRQQAGDSSGPCRWEPDNPSLWMRVVHCDGMEQQGWVQRGKWRKLWYRPAGAPEPPPVVGPAEEPPPAPATDVPDPAAAAPPAPATDAPDQAAAAPPAPDEGVVFVYHLSESNYAQGMGTLAMRRALIYVDDRKVAALTHATHARIVVPPGPHAFAAKVSLYGMPGLPIGATTLDVQGGGTYYLHYFEQGMGVVGGYISQHMVQEDAQTGAAGVRLTRAKPVDQD